MKRLIGFGMLALLLGASTAYAAAVDYAQPSAWACRPGQEAICTTGLDALAVTPDGAKTPVKFVPATDPPIDCFYVYPTVSREKSTYGSMTLTPEVSDVVRAQAGRLASRCRLFAPIYRQLTLPGLRDALAHDGKPDWRGPYADVLAAWQFYMAHDNHGRGVVLMGHSQGTILLQQLIAARIDGAPDQTRLVAAFLAGDPALPVPQGARVGGVFKHIPLCAAAAETGCAYVWSSYAPGDNSERPFGRNPGKGMVAACVNPASPSGGPGELKAFLHRPAFAPDTDPPWVEVLGQLSAACITDAQGDVLRVTIQPSRFAELLHLALPSTSSGWGLHGLDVALAEGNVLDVISAETAAWMRAR